MTHWFEANIEEKYFVEICSDEYFYHNQNIPVKKAVKKAKNTTATNEKNKKNNISNRIRSVALANKNRLLCP